MEGSPTEAESLLACAGAEERQRLLGRFLRRNMDRLRAAVGMRLDARLSRRVSVSDVLQETCLEACERIDEYLRQPECSFYLWLRFLALQKVKTLYRRHMEAQERDVRREVSVESDTGYGLAGIRARSGRSIESPSQILMRAETKDRLHAAVDSMDPADREVIILRHFEHLSWAEAARVLGVEEPAVRKRHSRALLKLKDLLRGTSTGAVGPARG